MTGNYETVIGLEVHVELATKTKIFCPCSTKFGAMVNTHICPVCTGQPGTLPVLNKKVVEYAVSVGLATNCEIAETTRFDRKNYFYPDNPQNYQISQLYLPICYNGYVEIAAGDGKRKIRIREIHMEEDAGKLIHEGKKNGAQKMTDGAEAATVIDYNRAGVPLIEIVSEPDMRNADEVVAYLEKLWEIISYLGASDCKLNEGSMRADVNLSVRERGKRTLGTRTEMKNLNSFRAIAHAIEGEKKRQIALLENNMNIVQETRRWDENEGTSHSMRSKEDTKDYRYFPEPDLPKLVLDRDWVEEIKSRQPEMREEKLARFVQEYGLPEYDARILTQSKRLADFFEETARISGRPKKVSNWLMGETMRLLKEHGADVDDIPFSPENLAKLIAMVDEKTVNQTVAKDILAVMYEQNIEPGEYAGRNGLASVCDEGKLREIVLGIIEENPKPVQDYRNGKEKAFGFLVGQTMRFVKGKAAPDVVNRLLRELL